MGKKKGPRRSHLRTYAAHNTHVSRIPVAEKLAEYQNSVKSITGPKNNSEPVLENSFTRPVSDGVAGRFRCSKCGKVFYTTISWSQHLKKFSAKVAEDHEPIFEPDMKKGHVIADVANTLEGPVVFQVYKSHAEIPTPRKEVETTLRVWQSKTRQGFDEWKYFRVSENKGAVLYLGFNGEVWHFKRKMPDGAEKFTIEYNSREQAMFYWDNFRLVWKP